VTYDLKTNDLVSNPVPELLSLRGASVASEQKVALAANSVHHVEKTAGGAAASADIEVNFTVPQVCISEVRFDLITSKGRFELAPNPACLPACLPGSTTGRRPAWGVRPCRCARWQAIRTALGGASGYKCGVRYGRRAWQQVYVYRKRILRRWVTD
jgi:hypothetical protein